MNDIASNIRVAVAWADIILTDILEVLKTIGLTFLVVIAVVLVFWGAERMMRRRRKVK